MSGVLTLLTDFGRRDPWVAEVKGAIASQWARWPVPGPRPQMIDLGHDIPRGDIAAGSWFLERVAATFPAGTVHLAVIDPGVGSQRPAVACRARGQCFVGPGNGLLSFLAGEPELVVVRLEELTGRGHPRTGRVSGTFHGRDLFAPAAARLAMGEPVALLGPAGDSGALGPAPPPADGPRLVWIDHFGNAISDLDAASPAGRRLAAGGRLTVAGRTVAGPRANYEEAPDGEPFWYWGSGGAVEIAVPGGSAAARLGLSPGLALAVTDP